MSYMLKDNLSLLKKLRQIKIISVLSYLTLIFMLSTQGVYAKKKMYRWVDESGNVFVSDKIPPDQVQHKRESLNTNARVIETVEKEKTKEQQELAKRLAKLRQQQQKIIEKQKSHDKVLLSTFRTLADMKMALKGKMLAMDGQRKVVEGNLIRVEKQLQQQQKRAAQFERDGRKVPTNILQAIESSKQQVEQGLIEVSRQFEKKKRTRELFEADIDRFVFLTQSTTGSKELSHKTAESKAANELGLFVCESVEQCNQAWEAAKAFVERYSMTALDIETNKLIMSLTPTKDTELSLSVSKLKIKNEKHQLFLDIRCFKSSLGEELCLGEKATNIRRSFSRNIKATLEP